MIHTVHLSQGLIKISSYCTYSRPTWTLKSHSLFSDCPKALLHKELRLVLRLIYIGLLINYALDGM